MKPQTIYVRTKRTPISVLVTRLGWASHCNEAAQLAAQDVILFSRDGVKWKTATARSRLGVGEVWLRLNETVDKRVAHFWVGTKLPNSLPWFCRW